jgi:hypothetical protein
VLFNYVFLKKNGEREMNAEQQRKWRVANPEKAREYSKKWREAHPEQRKVNTEQKRKWRADNPEKDHATQKRWRQRHPEKAHECAKKWSREHPERVKELARKNARERRSNPDYRKKERELERIRYAKNIEACREEERLYFAAHPEIRRRNQAEYRKKHPEETIVRNALNRMIRGKKSAHAQEYIGCSFGFLRNYLESQFKPGMTWENWGRGRGKWHVDHIVPLSWFPFDLDPSLLFVACHWSNLRPMWGTENLSKNNRYAA